MVVEDFNTLGMAIHPHKTYTPLIIYANAELSVAVPLKRLQTIPGRSAQFVQAPHGVQKLQPSARLPLETRKCPDKLVILELLGRFAGEAEDHSPLYSI
jgi:ABC-type antimicrobial peptide transport system ATPase subunit